MATPSAEQVVAGYQTATEIVRDRVMLYAKQMWALSPSLRDADVDRLVARIVPVVQAGQIQIARLTDAYIAQSARLAGVSAVSNVGLGVGVVNYRGVPATEVYRRPAVETYTALSKGKPYADAAASGASRLLSIVSTDLQQSKNRQAQRSFASSGFEYTIRVLTGKENCALCVIASTQRYRKGYLMPIHPGCDCGQRGVKAGADPGQVINPDLLEATHAQIATKLNGSEGGEIGQGNPISDYLDLIVTNEHGELGPTLGWRSDHFTGPDDLH